MPSKEMETIIELLKGAPTKEGQADLSMLRQGYELLVSVYEIGSDIEVSSVDEPYQFKVLKSKDVTSSGAILYLHGGGYCIGSPKTHAELSSRIARETSYAVYLLDYPLAPEHPFPAAFNCAVGAYEYLAKSFEKVIVSGDSAGGGLALSVLQHVIANSDYRPLAGILLSPWTDLALTGETLISKAQEDPLVSKESLAQMANWYLNGADPKDPKASPLYGDFKNMVPLLIQVGSKEVLYSDAERVYKLAQQHCDQVFLECYEGAIHVFQQIVANSPEAQNALKAIGKFIKGI